MTLRRQVNWQFTKAEKHAAYRGVDEVQEISQIVLLVEHAGTSQRIEAQFQEIV